MRYESVPVPFVQIGNRRGLTSLQLLTDPDLKAFVERFPASFEPGPVNIDCVLFIEPEPQAGHQKRVSALLRAGEPKGDEP